MHMKGFLKGHPACSQHTMQKVKSLCIRVCVYRLC